jgi:ATP-dependent exoDNAse (exonuclease V) beta subunit
MTRDAGLLHADEQARADALDVERSLIVQAPAGSGKTELLIQRYLRLLAIVDNPEEVVAITFTRKAAAEMKVRVLQALLRAQRSETPDEPHERVTAAAAEAALARDAMLGWQIIANPRRMRIQTLDALNAAIARMQPVTGGASAANAVAGDAEMRALYRSAAAATLDWLAETGPVRDAVEDVLTHVDNNTGIYISYLARMLETRDQWLPFVGTGQFDARDDIELRKNLEDKLAGIVEQHLQQTREAFPAELETELFSLATYAARNLRKAGIDENPVSELDELRALPAAASESLHQWSAIVEFLMTRKGDLRKRVNKNQGFPPGDDGQKDRLQELLESLAGHADLLAQLQWVRVLPPTRYGDDQWSVLLALFHLLPMAVAELQQLFSANGVTDYIEIALAADNALGTADDPGDIALLLDYQVRHLLVDEMQDTSRAQYRMLEALTGGWQPDDGRTLFCVGDPMQSIYRFRNAEVAQFLLAQRKGIGDVQLKPLLLRQNFRSGEFLVHWFNTVFPLVLPETDDPSRGAVSYSEAVPARQLQGDCHVYPVFGGAPEAEAEEGCRIIADTLAANPDESMAVLVRSRTQLSHLLPRLRAAGIAYQSVDIDRLTDLPEIIDVLALTRATVHPCDRLAWLAVLRSPWMGWNWGDLHSLVRNDTGRTVWELLNDEDRLLQVSDYARQSLAAIRPVLESLFEVSRSASLRDRIERAWLQLGGPAILQGPAAVENVYRFFDVLGKLEVAGSLHDVVELEAQLDLERVSTNVSARLQIMTMHRAKGLQFDHVLLYGLGRIPRSSERSVLSWFDVPDEHGIENKIISPVGRRSDVENDPIHRFIETADAQKDRHEFGRLLYVACTRARKSLHLLGHTGIASDGETIRPPHSRSLLCLLWPALAPQYEAAFESAVLPPSREDRDGWLLPQRSRIEPAWKLPDSSDVPGQRAAAGGHENVTAVEYDWAGAEARVTGTIVHRWLQLAAEGRVDLAVEPINTLRATSERWLREAGVAAGATKTLIERVEKALANITSDPRGQWLLEGDGFAELALTGVVDNTVESGVIDRVRVDDDGTHWIVDYKSSTHEGGGLQDFLDAEARRYRDQLARYADLYRAYSGKDARCALYFPLLQAFVEVRV